MRKTPLWLWILGLLGGAFFFWRAPALWPLVNVDLHVPSAKTERLARTQALALGLDLRGFAARTAYEPDDVGIDALDSLLGRKTAQAVLAGGAPVVRNAVEFTRSGDPHRHRFDLHPGGNLLFYQRGFEDDDPPISDAPRADAEARATLGAILSLPLADWKTISVSERKQPNRTERNFVYERLFPENPAFRERCSISFAGNLVARVARSIVAPPAFGREVRRSSALGESLEMVGLLLFAPAILAGGAVFLLHLRAGTARLRGPALLSGGAFGLLLIAYALRKTLGGDPLAPDSLEFARRISGAIAQYGWTFALLFAVISAGDSLDREGGFCRGATLQSWATGRWRAPGVGDAARNGFLLGLLCGGVMAVVVGVLENIVGARAALQPRHFALFMLNTLSPPLASVAYFVQIALLEELGYRYFAGTWLLGLTKKKWLAVGIPALVYGLTHTNLAFLPPAEPFWARALVMALVGAVWGAAFFRFDALTVVLSHLTADLFIFNWPGIARGDLLSIAVVLIPLLPALARGRYASGSAPTSGAATGAADDGDAPA